jgi:ribosomal protein L19
MIAKAEGGRRKGEGGKGKREGGTMATADSPAVVRFEALKPGDQIEVEHAVTVGVKRWTTTTSGTVIRTERRRHGLHFRRNVDDKVFSDVIVLQLPDGELTTVTLDEYTVIRRA